MIPQSLLIVMLVPAIACGKVDDAKPDAKVPAPDAAILPVVSGIMPSSGIITTVVTISGIGFGSAKASVSVDGTQATIQAWTDTSITATIPDVLPGSVDIVVTTPVAATAPQRFRVVLPPRVYLNNDADAADTFDSVTTLVYDPTTGALAQAATVSLGVASTSFGGCATSVIVNEHTRRLFASGTSAVAVFDIDPITGALTAVVGSPFATGGTEGYGLAVNSAGTRLWLADNGGHIVVFDVAGTGVLTPVVGSPFTTPNDLDTIALSMDETYVFANSESEQLLAYASAADGTLTAVAGSPFTTPGFDFAMVRRPSADQLFIGQGSSLEIWQVTNGTPAQIVGSPFPNTVPSGSLHHAAFTPDSNHVYVDTYSAGYIFGFSLDAMGTPTAMAGSPWNLSANVASLSCIAVGRDGTRLIAVDEGNARVGVFDLATDGTPTAVAGSPFTQTTTPESASGLAITF